MSVVVRRASPGLFSAQGRTVWKYVCSLVVLQEYEGGFKMKGDSGISLSFLKILYVSFCMPEGDAD